MSEKRKKSPSQLEMPKSPAEAEAAIEAWMKQAKPNTGAMVASEYGMLLLSGRGQFDIQETVIAVPLPFLVQLLGSYLTNGVAPLLAAIPVRKPGQPPLRDAFADAKGE